MEPLYLANEGKLALFCHKDDALKVLDAMRGTSSAGRRRHR